MTAHVLTQRRLNLLSEMGAKTPLAKSTQGACHLITSSLRADAQDVPYALIYSIEDTEDDFSNLLGNKKTAGIPFSHQKSNPKRARLIATTWDEDLTDAIDDSSDAGTGSSFDNTDKIFTTGVSKRDIPEWLPITPSLIEFDGASEEASWPIQTLVTQKRPYILHPTPSSNHGHQLSILLPIYTSRGGRQVLSAVFIAGISPFRQFDPIYMDFFRLVAGHIDSALTNGRSREEERRQTELMLQLTNQKNLFFQNVSHELRTPLTLMLGPLQTITKSHPEIANIDLVYRNARRLLKLVNSLLQFSSVEADRLDARFEEQIAFDSLTKVICETFKPLAKSMDLSYKIDTRNLTLVGKRNADEIETRGLFVDMDMWEKIVFNLLTNAFKHTWKGGVTARLSDLTNENGQEGVVFEVTDTGVGIAADQVPYIFDRFYRVENKNARSHEGTGIGLALAKELVQLHGGHINVQSTPGRGTSFFVWIPSGTAHLPIDKVHRYQNVDVETREALNRRKEKLGIREEDFFLEEAKQWAKGYQMEGIEAEAKQKSRRPRLETRPSNTAVNPMTVTGTTKGTGPMSPVHLVGVSNYVGRRSSSTAASSPTVEDGLQTDPISTSTARSYPFENFHSLTSTSATTPDEEVSSSQHSSGQSQDSGQGQGVRFSDMVKSAAPGASAQLDDILINQTAIGPNLVDVQNYVDELFRQSKADERPDLGSRRSSIDQSRSVSSGDGHSSRGAAMGPPPKPQAKPTVLLVDDSKDMRDYITSCLQNDFKVVEANNGLQALKTLANLDPDLILSDIMMPLLDGISLVRILRASPKCKHIPVVLLTARAGVDSNIDGLEAGADDYITKPFSSRELLARCNVHTKMSKMRSQVARAKHDVARLEASNEAKNKLLALVSHELRTPLSSVIGTVDLLQATQPQTEEQRGYIGNVQSSAGVLYRIIEDILDVAKIDSGSFSFSDSKFKLPQLIEDSCEMLAIDADRKLLDYITIVDRQIPNVVETDRVRIGQVLTNLIKNAVKFTEGGEIVVRVSIDEGPTIHRRQSSTSSIGQSISAVSSPAGERSAELERTVTIVFEVSDTGIGIDKNDYDKIFETFFQVDQTSTRRYDGAGLGLAIAMQLVRKAGGTIGLNSEIGKGSSFWFKWPLLVHPDNGMDYGDVEMGISDPPQVLIVSNRPLVRESLVESIAGLGWLQQEDQNVGMASDLDTAWGMLEKLASDASFHADSMNRGILLLTDINLAQPNIEGCKNFLRHVRAQDRPIKLTLISTRNQSLRHFEGLIDSVVTQPLHRSHVLTAYRRALNGPNPSATMSRSESIEGVHVGPVDPNLAEVNAVRKRSAYAERMSTIARSRSPSPRSTPTVLPNSPTPSLILKRKRLIIAEDNLINQAILVKQLRKLGYDSATANDGTKVIELLENYRDSRAAATALHGPDGGAPISDDNNGIGFDGILMDIDMPICDGFQATRLVRQMGPGYQQLPIIAITANAMSGDREKCLAAGMSDYMSKPVTMKQLASMASRWLPDT